MRQRGMFDPARLVFSDETWTSTSIVGLRGRCPRRERLICAAGALESNYVCRLRERAMVAPFVLEGAMHKVAGGFTSKSSWHRHRDH
jgi:hypothetical protein